MMASQKQTQMKINSKKGIAAKIFVAIAILGGLSSCKGRTMENMEPTGDTVEVEIAIPGQEPADTAMTVGEPSAI